MLFRGLLWRFAELFSGKGSHGCVMGGYGSRGLRFGEEFYRDSVALVVASNAAHGGFIGRGCEH